MTPVVGWVLLGCVLLFLISFSVGVVRYYSDGSESSKVTKVVIVLALFVQLLVVLMLPVDVFVVASNVVAATGVQVDAQLTADNGQALKSLYYVMYAAIGVLAFLLLPFAFFFYEEDDEEISTRERVCAASKYTLGFVAIMVTLMIVGIFLNADATGTGSSSWINVIKDSYAAADRLARFFVACLSAFGCLFLVVYTSYGMAYLPMSMIRGQARTDGGSYDAYTPINGSARNAASAASNSRTRGRSSNYPASGAAASSGGSDTSAGVDNEIRAAQRKNQERISFLTSRYAMSSDAEWSQSDRLQLHDLKREEKRLASLVDVQRQSFTAARAAANDDSCSGKLYACASGCVSACVDAVGCVRTLLGIVLLLLSLVLVASLGNAAVDRLLHSTCKSACGYAVDAPAFNPVNYLLVLSSAIFPMDYFVFGGIALYMFVCTVVAMCALGIRLLCVTYPVRKGATMQNALVLLAFVLIFVTLALNVQLQTLAPQYSSFGTQFYLAPPAPAPGNLTSTTVASLAVDLVKTDCSLQQLSNSTAPTSCVLTQASRFTHTLTTTMPVFGLIFFFTSLAFVGLFALFLLRFAVCKMSTDDEAHHDDEESNL